MSLVQAIDESVAYIRAHDEHMTRAEVDKLIELGQCVYVLAVEAGIADCLPKVPELRPELESQVPPLPPVQFVSKLNLPGDWDWIRADDDNDLLPSSYPLFGNDEPRPPDRILRVFPTPRWYQDMAALRMLAETIARQHADGSEQSSKTAAKSDVSLDARALGVFIEHPEWTKKRIADHLDCNEKSLAPTRCPKLAAAIAAHKSPIDPGRRHYRGSKDAEGNLEAYEDVQ